MKPPLPRDETARLEALRQYDVLDTAPEQEFDDLTHLASQICGTPISIISLVDEERLWFKSRVGLGVTEIPRAVSFCTQAIEQKDFLLIPDTLADARFAANGLVNGDPPLRFYAGVPLLTPEGHAVGTLCVLDTVPRQLDDTQQDALHRLARQALALLEARPDATDAKGQSRQARQRAERRRLTLAAETARRDADNLKASEERCRRLFESAQGGILILDAQSGKIEDVNPYLCALLGYAPHDLVGRHFWEIGAFRDIRDIRARKQAAAAEQESQRFLQSTLDALASHIAVMDEKGTIIAVNKAWREFSAQNQGTGASCGVGANYLQVCDVADGAWAEEAPEVVRGIREVMAGRHQAFCLEYPCHSPSEERWFNVCVTPFSGEGPVRVVVAHENITARKRAEQELRASQIHHRAVLQSALDAIVSMNHEGRVVEWNPAAEKMFGYEREAALGRAMADLIVPPSLRERHWKGLEHYLHTGEGVLLDRRSEITAMRADGSEFPVELGITRHSLDGPPVFSAYIRDITERKQVENALRASEERFVNIVANVPGMVYQFAFHPDGTLEWPFVSEGCREIYETEPETLRNDPLWPLDRIHPDDRPEFDRSVAASAESLSPWRWEGRHNLDSGKTIWIQGASRPQRLPDGGTQWDGLVMNITALKQAQQALHKANDELELHVMERTAELGAVNESLQLEMAERRRAEESLYKNHEFLETILDNTAEGIVACDAEGQLIFVNRATRDFHGLPLEPLPADQWSQYYSLYLPDGVTPMPKEDVPLFRALRGDHVRDTEMVITPLEGRPRFLIANGEPLFDADGARLGAVVVMHDITEHKQVENALREAEERFRIAAHSASDLIYDLDLASNRLTWLGDIEGQLGYAAGTFPHTLEAWEGVIHPDDHERVMTAVERFLQGGESFSEEYRVVRRDGTFLYWTDRGMMLRDERGTPYRWIGATSNITERKQAEVELQRAKKEAEAANLAKSEFLSRMSHELRTPLNSILGFGQILQEEAGTALQKESVGYILKGGRHLLDLINEVLDIARVESGHLEISPEPIALDDVVPETCALLRPLAAQRNIRLDENTSELGHSYILADRQRLRQVLFNLLSNAIKYNREGGEVEVFCGQKPDGRTSIAVRDTGQGIAPHDLTKLFTPFERLGASNSNVEGTGLGLVLSQRLVTEMGGTLKVESTLGQGTTFTFELPQATAPEKQLANLPHYTHSADTRREAEGTYCVLCIEDNPANLRLLEVLFQGRPELTLMAALQGSVGLDLARQHEPDLILLDLNLPDIHGKEVLARLQQSALTRDIPVVVVSADATPNQVERLLTAGAKAYLSKPLDVKNFFHTLNMFLPMPPTIAPQPHNDEKVVN